MRIKNIIFLIIFFCLGFAAGFLVFYSFKNHKEVIVDKSYYLSAVKANTIEESKPLKKEIKILRSYEDLRDDLLLQGIPSLVEINFPQMKVRVYKNGDLKKEANISARGDVQTWGGTSAGLYSIIYKNKLAYSGIANVNMPYAMNFYGKYFIHGVPYYDNGNKRITDVTGGCVQLADEDAKEVFELTEQNTPVVAIDKYNDRYYEYVKEEITDFPLISAKNYLVADLDSGFILAEKNADEKYPIASLTKLMTAVIIAENVDLRRSILVTEDMLKAYGGTNGLVSGKSFNVVELFYPLLIESSNDAAEVLSGFLGREKTMKLMNDKTKSLLMENTSFADPHGFDPANISTAKDLFYLVRYILNNRSPIFNITKGEEVKSYGELSFKALDNKNLFFNDENFIGGKTGYIKTSGYNGIFLMKFVNNNVERKIVMVVLGSENLLYGEKSLKVDTQKIIDWINENFFSPKEIINQ